MWELVYLRASLNDRTGYGDDDGLDGSISMQICMRSGMSQEYHVIRMCFVSSTDMTHEGRSVTDR